MPKVPPNPVSTEVTISLGGNPNANATMNETIINDMKAFSLKPVINTIKKITPSATINNGIVLSSLTIFVVFTQF